MSDPTVIILLMNKNLTEIAYILDRSLSMTPLREAAIKAFNEFLAEQTEAPGEARLSLVLFDNEYQMPLDSLPIQEILPLTAEDYEPQGYTALLDAIGITIDRIGKRLASTPEEERPGQVVIGIFTDGEENSSTQYSLEKINEMIREQRDKYSWEFLFLAAGQDAIATAASMGIDGRSAANIDYSADGMSIQGRALSRRASAYRRRQAGELSVEDAQKSLEQIVREEQDKQ